MISKYRMVHQCDKCGKIYRSDYWPTIYNGGHIGAAMVCGNCGSIGRFLEVIAKPKLFGLRGWVIAKGSQKHHES